MIRFMVTTMAVAGGIGAALGMAFGIGFAGMLIVLACT
jgi:hypothetical protein